MQALLQENLRLLLLSVRFPRFVGSIPCDLRISLAINAIDIIYSLRLRMVYLFRVEGRRYRSPDPPQNLSR